MGCVAKIEGGFKDFILGDGVLPGDKVFGFSLYHVWFLIECWG